MAFCMSSLEGKLCQFRERMVWQCYKYTYTLFCINISFRIQVYKTRINRRLHARPSTAIDELSIEKAPSEFAPLRIDVVSGIP